MKTRKHNGGKIVRKKKLSAWQRSAEFRMVARDAIMKHNRERHLRPKCGAMARSTGEPCKGLAMENGRCHIHGGKTPSGDGWHLPKWPDKAAPNAVNKLNAKLTKREREYKARQRRLAAMTPAEQAQHDKWQKTHKPGSPIRRAVTREEKRQIEAAKILLIGLSEKYPQSEPSPVAAEVSSGSSTSETDQTKNEMIWLNIGVFG